MALGRSYMDKSDRELPFTSSVRSQGRITIPQAVRVALDIREDDLVHIKIRKVENREHAPT